jgi:hypothetical protein
MDMLIHKRGGISSIKNGMAREQLIRSLRLSRRRSPLPVEEVSLPDTFWGSKRFLFVSSSVLMPR